MPRFKHDKSKVEKYQLALTTSLGNLWVDNSIGHLGADGLVNLLQQCVGVTVESIFGNKPQEGVIKRDIAINPGLMPIVIQQNVN
jgi:hypothetical protein